MTTTINISDDRIELLLNDPHNYAKNLDYEAIFDHIKFASKDLVLLGRVICAVVTVVGKTYMNVILKDTMKYAIMNVRLDVIKFLENYNINMPVTSSLAKPGLEELVLKKLNSDDLSSLEINELYNGACIYNNESLFERILPRCQINGNEILMFLSSELSTKLKTIISVVKTIINERNGIQMYPLLKRLYTIDGPNKTEYIALCDMIENKSVLIEYYRILMNDGNIDAMIKCGILNRDYEFCRNVCALTNNNFNYYLMYLNKIIIESGKKSLEQVYYNIIMSSLEWIIRIPMNYSHYGLLRFLEWFIFESRNPYAHVLQPKFNDVVEKLLNASYGPATYMVYRHLIIMGHIHIMTPKFMKYLFDDTKMLLIHMDEVYEVSGKDAPNVCLLNAKIRYQKLLFTRLLENKIHCDIAIITSGGGNKQ